MIKIDYKIKKRLYIDNKDVSVGVICEYKGKEVAILWRNEKHFFIKFNGFGIDLKLYNFILTHTTIEDIIIYYTGSNGLIMYFSKIDDWLNGEIVEYEGYGKQIVLPKTKMKEEKTWQEQQAVMNMAMK